MTPPNNEPPESPENLAEWLWYVKDHEESIYVREGNLNKRLSDLPPERWGAHVARMLGAGILPVRVREPKA